MFVVLALFAANIVQAEAEPTSKCLTQVALSKKSAAEAQLAKDIASYLDNPKAQDAIKAYRDALIVAWEAMTDPYCGYGSYGTASSVKSYGKSTERARLAFLASVKTLKKSAVAVKAESKPAAKASPTAAAKIMSGLRRGQKSAAVLQLQKRLAAHYKLSENGLVTGFFGPVTERLVIKFQLEKKIVATGKSPGAGLVGPKTSTALNAL